MNETASPARKRDSASTRQAILVAARRRFAGYSYDNVGLRDIAKDAGIDVALVNRYFGSKEQLFEQVLRSDEGRKPSFDDLRPADFPAYLTSLVMDLDGDAASAKLERFLIMLRSSSSPQAKAIVSAAIEDAIISPITAQLEGENARLRASMALIVMMGSGIVRNVMAQSTVCELDEGTVRAQLTALFERAFKMN